MSAGPWSIIQTIAEQRIREAQEAGEFDNLPGSGQPLRLDDLRDVPEELRMAYTLLRNAGCLPPELEERREFQRAADLLAACADERERMRQIEKLRFMALRARMRHQRPLMLEENDAYYERILARLEKKVSKPS